MQAARKSPPLALLFALIIGSPMLSVGHADTLLIERAQDTKSIAHPKRGASMSQVEAEFGPPLHRVGPVGAPPITRWVYAEITVYFEHDHVISSVLNKASGLEKGPKPVRE
ncbi:MAG: hypothetical protein AB7V26_08755 [Lysobacterales bacterium]